MQGNLLIKNKHKKRLGYISRKKYLRGYLVR